MRCTCYQNYGPKAKVWSDGQHQGQKFCHKAEDEAGLKAGWGPREQLGHKDLKSLHLRAI